MEATTTNGHADGADAIEIFVAAARDYVRRGLSPVPLLDGKNPSFARWQKFEFSEDLFRMRLIHATEPGVGVLFGPKSCVVDFEYDSPAQQAKLLSLFPDDAPPVGPQFTSTHGEHWLFAWDDRLEAIGKATLEIPCDDETKLKLRIGAGGKGAQSAFPPSRGKAWKPGLSPDDCNPPPLPEATIALLLEYAKPKRHKLNGNAHESNGRPKGELADRCLAAMRKVEVPAAETDSSNRLLAVARQAKRYGFVGDDGVKLVRQYAVQHPFAKDWTDTEILRRIGEAAVEAGEALCDPAIANFEVIEIEGDDGETKEVAVPLSMSDIIDTIRARTGDWPRRIDNVLFVDDPKHGLDWFDRRTTAGLFGWLRRLGPVKWAKGGSFVGQAELFAEIERTATRYEAIELLPHEPAIAGIYYRGEAPSPGDGKHLRKLLDRFRPETTVDRDLIQAAMMTAFWGGLPGCRPVFVITSDDGRGVGKSAVAQVVGHVCDGFLDVSAGEDILTLKSRLLSPDARTKRIALLDNVKTLRFSWAEWEAMITSPTISGRQLYVGEGQRPNLLTWFVTLNGVNLATDIAQRSIIIKVSRGTNDGPWWEQTRQYIDDHRAEIVGDIIGALRGPAFPLAEFSRWATWEQHVLCRLSEPGEAQKVILERQGAANCEQEEAEIIEEFFAEQLSRLGYCPQTAQVRIPNDVAARWFGWAVGEPTKTAAVTRKLKQMADEGQAKRIAPDSTRTYGRGFIWTGPAADVVGQPISNDLRERVARIMESNRST